MIINVYSERGRVGRHPAAPALQGLNKPESDHIQGLYFPYGASAPTVLRTE